MPHASSHPLSSIRREILEEHQDHVWGRLPFLVPMAARVADACGEGTACEELPELLGELRATLLDHLDHEEIELLRVLEDPDPDAARRLLDGLHGEHVTLAALLDRVQAAASEAPREARCVAQATFERELELLAYHIRAQIALEENVLAQLTAVD